MEKRWWKESVVYQIYPRSFCDSNGDGIGDLNGITGKLDYLKELGIDVIWLSPVYKSPNDDNGYDISDYQAIMDEFGTMEDFDRMLATAHEKGIKIMMDLVVNHTSDEHKWFIESRKSTDNPYRDYYIWRPAKEDGSLPNNWGSCFSGPAWEYDKTTDMYFLHLFSKKQPDLNWENPKLRQELYNMINWWLEKGLAGFRIDAIINIKKDLAFPDYEPDGPDGMAACWKMVENVDGVGEFLEDLKKNTFQKYDAFTVGEVFNMKADELGQFIGDNGHFSTIFDFCAHSLSDGAHGWYDAPHVDFKTWRDTILSSQINVQKYGLEANIIENHDEPRGVSRFLPKYAQTPVGTKMLGTVNILLRGIPFIYQGQEIGMQNEIWNDIHDYNDISTIDQYKLAREAGLSDTEALEVCGKMSRDNARTPVQWNAQVNAGFTTGTPWLRVHSDYKEINVAAQEKDPDSVLNYYRKLTAIRKAPEYKEVFTYGKTVPAYQDSETVMAYYRETKSQRILVAANFGREAVSIKLEYPVKKILLDNQNRTDCPEEMLKLDSCEVIVLECEK